MPLHERKSIVEGYRGLRRGPYWFNRRLDQGYFYPNNVTINNSYYTADGSFLHENTHRKIRLSPIGLL